VPRTKAGRFLPGVSGNPIGRPPGVKDKLPRGSVAAVFRDFISTKGGHDKMLEAVDAGVKNHRRALGYLELGARVLDRVDAEIGRPVTIYLVTNVQFDRLVQAGQALGLTGTDRRQLGG